MAPVSNNTGYGSKTSASALDAAFKKIEEPKKKKDKDDWGFGDDDWGELGPSDKNLDDFDYANTDLNKMSDFELKRHK